MVYTTKWAMPPSGREIPCWIALARAARRLMTTLNLQGHSELEVKHPSTFLCCFFPKLFPILIFSLKHYFIYNWLPVCQEQCLRYKDEDIQGGHLKSQRHRLNFRSGASFWIPFLFVSLNKLLLLLIQHVSFYTFLMFCSWVLENVGREIWNSLSVSVISEYINLLVK